MSRSLDKDVLENLKTEDPTKVYQDIARVLTSLPNNGDLLEIELLGKAHPLEAGVNYLQDENAIAIPKLRLTQAFFVAHRLIQQHLSSQPRAPNSDTLAATAVALLMDPEHLTAANIRKRFVLSQLEEAEQAETVLRHEKQFLDSLLAARLHRHTKSPTLWNHRRWLLGCCRTSNCTIDLRGDFSSVIMVAAERHPRNYYAWHHARWLTGSGTFSLDASLLSSIIDDVKDWCFRHHNDISGWTFLSFLLMKIEDTQTQIRKRSAIFSETLRLSESFRWTNESVWVFLRTIVARNHVSPELCDSFFELNRKLSFQTLDKTAKMPLEAAVQWVAQHRQVVQ
jgi:protein prenyltransferase alpha subunit repeat containing protein 1